MFRSDDWCDDPLGRCLDLRLLSEKGIRMLELATTAHGSYCVLKVVGEVDLATSPQLSDRIAELIAGGNRHLAVDLSGVGFIDSTGLGVLVGGNKKVRPHHGTFCLIAPDGVGKILRITGLQDAFASYQSLEDLPPLPQAPNHGAPAV